MFFKRRLNPVEIPEKKRPTSLDSYFMTGKDDHIIWNWLCEWSPQIFLVLFFIGFAVFLWWLL